MDKLDDFDWQILDLLRRDSRRTGEELSDLVGLSPAACLRRLQRLRKTGAIAREVAILSPDLASGGTILFVLLTIDRHNPKVMDDFCHRLRRQAEVRQLHWVTGEDDIIVILDCASMAHFADFCQAHLDDTPVSGYKTLVSMRAYETDDPGQG